MQYIPILQAKLYYKYSTFLLSKFLLKKYVMYVRYVLGHFWLISRDPMKSFTSNPKLSLYRLKRGNFLGGFVDIYDFHTSSN